MTASFSKSEMAAVFCVNNDKIYDSTIVNYSESKLTCKIIKNISLYPINMVFF